MPFSPSSILSPGVSLSHFTMFQGVYPYYGENWSSICSALQLTRTPHAMHWGTTENSCVLCTYTAPQVLNWEKGGWGFCSVAKLGNLNRVSAGMNLNSPLGGFRTRARPNPPLSNQTNQKWSSPISPEMEIMEDLPSFWPQGQKGPST